MSTAHESLFALAVLWCLFCAFADKGSRWSVTGLIAVGATHWVEVTALIRLRPRPTA